MTHFKDGNIDLNRVCQATCSHTATVSAHAFLVFIRLFLQLTQLTIINNLADFKPDFCQFCINDEPSVAVIFPYNSSTSHSHMCYCPVYLKQSRLLHLCICPIFVSAYTSQPMCMTCSGDSTPCARSRQSNIRERTVCKWYLSTRSYNSISHHCTDKMCCGTDEKNEDYYLKLTILFSFPLIPWCFDGQKKSITWSTRVSKRASELSVQLN